MLGLGPHNLLHIICQLENQSNNTNEGDIAGSNLTATLAAHVRGANKNPASIEPAQPRNGDATIKARMILNLN